MFTMKQTTQFECKKKFSVLNCSKKWNETVHVYMKPEKETGNKRRSQKKQRRTTKNGHNYAKITGVN